jgi:hypothetical protein
MLEPACRFRIGGARSDSGCGASSSCIVRLQDAKTQARLISVYVNVAALFSVDSFVFRRTVAQPELSHWQWQH